MRIIKEDCIGLVVDIQERLLPVMEERESFLKRCGILLGGLKLLEVPVLVTEQYPRGLGSTVPEIREAMQEFRPMEKNAFSCCDEPAFLLALEQSSRRNVIILGIEAHVCVLQTVADLSAGGYHPVVVADCTSSRHMNDKKVALERMYREGAVVTTCESILFELTRRAGNETFKAISALVKQF